MKLTLEVEQGSDGRWIAEVPELPGVMVYGHSREQAIREAESLALRVVSDRNLRDVVWVDTERMSGTPCFSGTRVPIAHLFEYLEHGDSIEDFLQGFPGVTREQVINVLKTSAGAFLGNVAE